MFSIGNPAIGTSVRVEGAKDGDFNDFVVANVSGNPGIYPTATSTVDNTLVIRTTADNGGPAIGAISRGAVLFNEYSPVAGQLNSFSYETQSAAGDSAEAEYGREYGYSGYMGAAEVEPAAGGGSSTILPQMVQHHGG